MDRMERSVSLADKRVHSVTTVTALSERKTVENNINKPAENLKPRTPTDVGKDVIEERSTRLPRAAKGHNQAMLDDMDDFLGGKEALEMEKELRGDDVDVSLRSVKKEEKPKEEKKAKEPVKSVIEKLKTVEEKEKGKGKKTVEEEKKVKEASSKNGTKTPQPMKLKTKTSDKKKKSTMTRNSDARKKHKKKSPRRPTSDEKPPKSKEQTNTSFFSIFRKKNKTHESGKTRRSKEHT